MSVSQRQRQYLAAMGIPVWVSRDGGALPAEEAGSAAARGEDAESRWQALEARVAACTRCELHKSRTQTVFGTGSHEARLLVIGEAPGADEDRQGEPFVGRAGRLLNEMLLAIGLRRETVYIANILKCRPPNNRDPRPEEVVSCEPWLKGQIDLLQPQVILAVGRIAAQNLLKRDERIGAMRGRVHHYGEARIPVIVTYHPAYLLRSPKEKRKAWEDLKKVRQFLASSPGA
ncbi:MAG TPA: uracil-DNA glycosylase [Gammaproteobacteria bacterium]|nr:uracil-DNA glycosylase [Gammaproteobacteria bacterium]